MSMRRIRRRCARARLSLGAGAALAENAAISASRSREADIKQWDIAILPDGTNLPPGSGTPAQGAKIFAEKCVGLPRRGRQGRRCAGLSGAGRRAAAHRRHRRRRRPSPTTTPMHDDLRLHPPRRCRTTRRARSPTTRSMRSPPIILALNKLIGENDVMDAKTLPQVKMPNRDNFIMPYPDRM